MRTFQFYTVFTVSLFREFHLDEAIRPFFLWSLYVLVALIVYGLG